MSRRNSNSDGFSCLVLFLLGLMAMPLVGLYMLLGNHHDDDMRALGLVLIIIGLVLWVIGGIGACS